MVRVLQFLFDVLVAIVIIRLISRLLFRSRSAARRGTAPPQTPERSGGTLVRDPQCGTYIPEARAIQARTGNSVLFFCSPACRDAYMAAIQPVAQSRG
jgi:uncharacterized protein